MKQRQSPAAKKRAQGQQIGDVLLVVAVGLALTTGFMISLWLGPGPEEMALAAPSAGASGGADTSDVSRLRGSYPDDTLVMTLRPSN